MNFQRKNPLRNKEEQPKPAVQARKSQLAPCVKTEPAKKWTRNSRSALSLLNISSSSNKQLSLLREVEPECETTNKRNGYAKLLPKTRLSWLHKWSRAHCWSQKKCATQFSLIGGHTLLHSHRRILVTRKSTWSIHQPFTRNYCEY